jgi:alpha-1,3-rhamnosyl/mannosyltransferase
MEAGTTTSSQRILDVGIDATTWSNNRGFGRFTRELVTALVARETGFRYTLVFDQPPRESLPARVEVRSAGTALGLTESSAGTRSRSIGYLWRMGRIARRARFDVFFFPAVYSYFPILARVPCVVCYHDATAERMPELLFPTRRNHWLWRAKTALARLQTTRAMTVSQASADDLERFLRIPRDRIDVVTEAADPVFRAIDDAVVAARARARHGVPEDALLLVYLGGMNRHKNVLGLLRAMPAVVSAQPRVHLAIVGDTSGKGFDDNVPELMHLVQSTPSLARHVNFTGYVGDAELAELLGSASALVFPSLWEGFGLPAVEAMSCGVPVLASRRGSLPEVVGDAGLFFEPESPSDIADCVLRFLGDPGLRLRLGEIGRVRARSFSWERAAELAEACFRRCHEDATR